MPALLDMSKIPLPAAVEELDYETTRLAWLARYAELRELELEDLNDNDPVVKALETGAYFEVMRKASNNDSVRQTMLASAWGEGLDDLGADPLYGNTPRLVLDEGDEGAVPPIPPTYETDDDYRARLALAPAELSVAGPVGAYESLAMGAHSDVVDAYVTSPTPANILIEVLIDPETEVLEADILAAVVAAISPDTKRPVGDRISVVAADVEPSTVEITVYVNDGPSLSVVQAASQARVDEIALPLAAKVRSGAAFTEGDESPLGACVVPGVASWEITDSAGMSDPTAAWWPLEITVTAVRTNA